MNNQSVRLLILNKGKELLLIKRTETETQEPSKLILPGGRVEEFETEIQALKREIYEELGLNIIPSNAIELGQEFKSSYNELCISYYYYEGIIEINKTHVAVDEVAETDFFNINKVQKNQIAFNEYEVIKEYYLKALCRIESI
jgi:8-oxo-dGTP pyrophosphatase MutT (NUDIX family)